MRKTRLSGDRQVPMGTDLYIVKTGEWRTQRPVVKKHLCKKCSTCYLFCPAQCIVEKAAHFEANLDFCKGCGLCAYECPAFAIVMVDEPEEP